MKYSMSLRLILSAFFIALTTVLNAEDSALENETLYGVTTPALRSSHYFI